MDIPLLSKEEIENEGTVGQAVDDEDIRIQIIEFLEDQGYRHVPVEQEFEHEVSDLFIKDEQLVEIVINNEIPKDVLERIV